MLCVFTSELLLTVEAAVDKFADAVSFPKTGEDAAAKAAAKWKKQASSEESAGDDKRMFTKYLTGLKNSLEADTHVETADFGQGDGHNGISYVPGKDRIFVGVDEGKVASVACYFQGKLLGATPIATLGRRASVELPNTQSPVKIASRRHSFRHDEPTEDEMDAQRVMEAYVNVAMAHNVGGCHLVHKDLCNSESLDMHMHRLKGAFAFVLYDRQRKRVVAGRDRKGMEPLFWATDSEGLRLYFATDKAALAEHGDRVKEFPAGGLYVSKAAELAGTLNGQMLSDPRYFWMPKPKADTSKLNSGSLNRRNSIPEQSLLL